MDSTPGPTRKARQESSNLTRGLGLLDATMIVIGSMIGSGIFIVSAESSRLVGTPGWLLAAWAIAGLMTSAPIAPEDTLSFPRSTSRWRQLRGAT
jgi:basic amino acid/polyamine antiporter, APA family